MLDAGMRFLSASMKNLCCRFHALSSYSISKGAFLSRIDMRWYGFLVRATLLLFRNVNGRIRNVEEDIPCAILRSTYA